jgi:hypothetical protein
LLRALDTDNRWNVTVIGLTAAAFGIGAVLALVLGRSPFLPVLASGTVFLSWAVTRELDPDHQLGAVLAAVVGGGWALWGMPTATLPFVGLLMVARILVETTGRRPLVSDLVGLVILAGVISTTSLGWIMGFGLAVAISLDDRMAAKPSRPALIASIGAAGAATAVVKLADALPDDLPTLIPALTIGVGVVAIVAVARIPVAPTSFADSRSKPFIRSDRLHAGRAVAAVLVFAGSVVQSTGARNVVPLAFALVVCLMSEEVERLRRARRDRR